MLIKFNYKVENYYIKYIYYNANRKLHRLGGPSYEYENGSKFWYKNGKRHREDGPASSYNKGFQFYYLNGKEYTEKQYWLVVRFVGFM